MQIIRVIKKVDKIKGVVNCTARYVKDTYKSCLIDLDTYEYIISYVKTPNELESVSNGCKLDWE